MKLKNNTLQELYDTLTTGTLSFALFAESPIDKAFEECDRELTNLQNCNDILEKSNGTLLDANLDLCTKNRDLKDRIRQLEKDLDEAKSSANYFRASRDDWRSRAKHEEEEKIEQVNKVFGEKVQLQEEIDQLKKDKEGLKQSRFEWAKRAVERGKKLNEAEKEIGQLKKDLDALLSRTHCAEDEVEQLKKDRDIWVRNNGEKQAEIAELKNRLDKANADRTALQKNLDYYMDIYKKVQDDYDDLHKKYSECQGTVDKQAEQIRHLKDRLNNISNACGRTQDDIYGHGYDQGQTDLWDMLQNVNDINVEEFDVECHSTNDVVSMDLEDFLDIYKKWQEQKETDRMREWLVDFCWGRVCEGCPLESKEYKCGRGYSFRMTDPSDLRIIPDKDIKRYYEKAHGCGRYTLNMEGTRKAIAKACDGFRKAVRDADTKITENLRKGCTFEAEVNVNKDLFEKLCGMKSEEEKPNPKGLVITTRGVTTANYTEATMNAIKEAVRKFEKSLPALDSWESTITGSIKVDDILGKTDDTEHKFEYGDAVRVSWSNFDYMYVGPDEHRIRLFDPKYHCVIFVSSTEKLTYQGCKIVLTDEDDLRKIWKDKK